MNKNLPSLIISLTDIPVQSSKPDLDPIGSNIENILAFYSREDKNVTHSQRILESIINCFGQPLWLAVILFFVVLWVTSNLLMSQLGFVPFDPSPLHWLQGIIGLAALLIMVVILIKQNRHDKIEERRAHLELQINLLTEQKTTKLINLMEELRRDLPMIKDRHDPELTAYQHPTNPEAVLAALDEHINTESEKQIDAKKLLSTIPT
ncbi:MAG: DUF1003 domain-containing protein [Oxalobacter sp.]|nr:MAG: DUF1003 domain-containing protein [Oxalobacter sp.]